jgi:hypothetical protein
MEMARKEAGGHSLDEEEMTHSDEEEDIEEEVEQESDKKCHGHKSRATDDMFSFLI